VLGAGGRRVEQSSDPLVTLRYLIATFAWAILLIGVVVAILGDMTSVVVFSPGLSIAVVVAIGLASLAAQKFAQPTLDCTSVKALAESYRKRFFLRVALSEAVALLSFVLGIVRGPWWIFYIGAALTLVLFWRLAPTRSNLRRDQDQLELSGCNLSLTAALRTPSA
jgi:F0F1-type ATP synthase membrane subunit c/vacuolar-type H+-ATPase subunit K